MWAIPIIMKSYYQKKLSLIFSCPVGQFTLRVFNLHLQGILVLSLMLGRSPHKHAQNHFIVLFEVLVRKFWLFSPSCPCSNIWQPCQAGSLLCPLFIKVIIILSNFPSQSVLPISIMVFCLPFCLQKFFPQPTLFCACTAPSAANMCP